MGLRSILGFPAKSRCSQHFQPNLDALKISKRPDFSESLFHSQNNYLERCSQRVQRIPSSKGWEILGSPHSKKVNISVRFSELFNMV